MNERALRDLPTLKGMWEYMAEIVRPGRLAPGSWGAALVEAAEKGEVDKQLLPALIGDYLVPSLDTTVSALSTMLWQLGENPDQCAWSEKTPPSSPTSSTSPSATKPHPRPVQIRHRRHRDRRHPPRPRQPALMVYASANRDERHWKDPDTFDVTRSNANTHVGFGHGIHGCVGQGLARLEGHSLLNALVRKVARIEVGQPTWRVHNTIRAMTTLPVEFSA